MADKYRTVKPGGFFRGLDKGTTLVNTTSKSYNDSKILMDPLDRNTHLRMAVRAAAKANKGTSYKANTSKKMQKGS